MQQDRRQNRNSHSDLLRFAIRHGTARSEEIGCPSVRRTRWMGKDTRRTELHAMICLTMPGARSVCAAARSKFILTMSRKRGSSSGGAAPPESSLLFGATAAAAERGQQKAALAGVARTNAGRSAYTRIIALRLRAQTQRISFLKFPQVRKLRFFKICAQICCRKDVVKLWPRFVQVASGAPREICSGLCSPFFFCGDEGREEEEEEERSLIVDLKRHTQLAVAWNRHGSPVPRWT